MLHYGLSTARMYRKVTNVTSVLMWTFHTGKKSSLDSYETKVAAQSQLAAQISPGEPAAGGGPSVKLSVSFFFPIG
jgi:hypothetical protein